MNIRSLYLYLFSFVGLLIITIGLVQIVDLGLKVYVFNNADRYDLYTPAQIDKPQEKLTEEEIKIQEDERRKMADRENTRQRQRQLSTSLAMIAVGTPLYLYHWSTINKENKKK